MARGIVWGAVLLLTFCSASRALGAEERALGRVRVPCLGVEGLDVDDPTHAAPERIALFEGAGRLLGRTVPIPWGRIEPHAPVMGGRHLHDWEALDALVATWQGAGHDLVIVLTPASPWASLPFPRTAWARRVREELPEAEANLVLARGGGAAPPRKDAWDDWERFVGAVVERYDADGLDDAAGLRRAVRWIQVVDRPASPEAWTGSAQDYLRLLHHASLGAAKADDLARVAHGTVDFGTLGRAPQPTEKEAARRLEATLRTAPATRRLEEERALEFALLTLSLRGVFRAAAHAGAGHSADEAEALAWLRTLVDEGAGTEAEIWLVDAPAEHLEAPEPPRAGGPATEELRLRSRWRATAHAQAGPADERGKALEWLRNGRAYDVVRTLTSALGAGADRVFLAGVPRATALDVFVEPDGDGGWRRNPAYYALRQAARLVTTHAGVSANSVGRGATAWRFDFAAGDRPWTMAVTLDADESWAGDPRGEWPTQEVAIPLPDGPYIVEQVALTSGEMGRRPVRVSGGVLRLFLTPAPVWIYPDL